MKKILLAATIAMSALTVNAQSPEQFLGYELGTRYTPHHKLVEYCKTLVQQNSAMMKMEQYGETNEHRPLYLIYISSAENIKNLEQIRKGNLQLAGDVPGSAAVANQKVIVWLSYNVHGNEPSSSEAAMKTMHALVQGNNAKAKQWLENTVVIIDPCLNPDGRDRYVHWFNSVVGAHYNAEPQSREHIEPWPGGRSNHYNFDLNRDWAWQTQVETQQRLKKYHEWLPQVHVDFHEQGYNEPYYFAPAAEPLHEVITPWQRDFQTLIGKNHARYFDEQGWLYFTKERFDLFYPSYGDTYPTYNGAIGMTYEQGGHSRGGLAVVTEDKDTLTLVDRVAHHYTTGMSTVEMASANAEKALKEFQQYYSDARSGKNASYKSYVITDKNWQKMQTIAQFLQQNKIAFNWVTNVAGRGFRYSTQKEDAIQLQQHSILVSALQNRGNLVKVLLEPNSKITDSNTYDITAWSIPYVHGVEAYALTANAAVASNMVLQKAVTPVTSSYGILVPYNSFASAKVLSALLKSGVKVRMAEKPFSYAGQQYNAGTLLVLKTNNVQQWQALVNDACLAHQIQPVAVNTGFMDKGADFGSPDVKIIHAPKVAMLTGEQVSSLGAGEVWNYFDTQLQYPISLFNANDFSRLDLKQYQVLILPDGYYRFMSDKNAQEKLKTFIREGGKLIALEGAVAQLAQNEWGIKFKDGDTKNDKETEATMKAYGDRERDYLTQNIPGAIFKVQLDTTHPLAFGYGNTYYTLKQDANLYEPLKDGWNVGVVGKKAHVAGFVGSALLPKIQNHLSLGVMDMGRGSVVLIADDPIFRMFWENGKLLLANAVFMVGN